MLLLQLHMLLRHEPLSSTGDEAADAVVVGVVAVRVLEVHRHRLAEEVTLLLLLLLSAREAFSR